MTLTPVTYFNDRFYRKNVNIFVEGFYCVVKWGEGGSFQFLTR